jgi:hypothetical protein
MSDSPGERPPLAEAVVRQYSYPALVDVAWCARIEPSSAAAWETGLLMRF